MNFPVLLLCGFLYAASALPSGIDPAYKTSDKKPDYFTSVALIGNPSSPIPLLSGVIISPSWVLTFTGSNFENNITFIRVGVSMDHLQIKNVTEVVLNPDKNTPLTLIKVAKPFKFDESVQPILLPNPDNQGLGEAVAAGWGEQFITIQNKTVIIPGYDSGKVLAIPNEACALWLPVAKETICTFTSYEFYRFSQFGGPLVQNGVLLGIAGSTPCMAADSTEFVKFFVRVTSALDFIKKHVTDL